jgi:hypothetical protein
MASNPAADSGFGASAEARLKLEHTYAYLSRVFRVGGAMGRTFEANTMRHLQTSLKPKEGTLKTYCISCLSALKYDENWFVVRPDVPCDRCQRWCLGYVVEEPEEERKEA